MGNQSSQVVQESEHTDSSSSSSSDGEPEQRPHNTVATHTPAISATRAESGKAMANEPKKKSRTSTGGKGNKATEQGASASLGSLKRKSQNQPEDEASPAHLAANSPPQDIRSHTPTGQPSEKTLTEKTMKAKRARKSGAFAKLDTGLEQDKTELDAQSADQREPSANKEETLVEHSATKRRSRLSRKSAAADAIITAEDNEDVQADQSGTALTEAQNGKKTRPKRTRKSGTNIAPNSTDANDMVNGADMAENDPAAIGPESSNTRKDAPQKRKRQSLRSADTVFADLDRSLGYSTQTPRGEDTSAKRVKKSRISGASAGVVEEWVQHTTKEAQCDGAFDDDTTLVNDASVRGQTDTNRRKSGKRKSSASLAKGVDIAATDPDDADNFALEHDHDKDAASSSPPGKAKKSRKSRKSGETIQTQLDRNGQISPPSKSDQVSSPAKKSGLWSVEERARLDAAINAYGDRFGLTKLDLISLIQYTIPTVFSDVRDTKFGVEDEIRTKAAVREFWAEIHQLFPDRTTTSIHRIARRRWHNYEKRGGEWTPDEDRLLTELNKLHPNQWKVISLSVKRSPEDCRDRWRNYIQYGDSRNTHHWTDDEVSGLNRAVSECIESLLEDRMQSKGSVDDYDPFMDLDWHIVSQKAGGTRSRLQCLSKWKSLQAANEEAGEDTLGTPASSARRSSAKASTRKRSHSVPNQSGWKKDNRVDKMLPGDKFQLIADITNANVAEEESIPWDEITLANPDRPWTSEDRKEAFKVLVNEVGRRKSLDDMLMAILENFTELGADTEQFYVPEQGEREVGRVASSQPNSTKKRNRMSGDAEQAKRFKSAHLISASDDELA